jgi:hypothetical protein
MLHILLLRCCCADCHNVHFHSSKYHYADVHYAEDIIGLSVIVVTVKMSLFWMELCSLLLCWVSLHWVLSINVCITIDDVLASICCNNVLWKIKSLKTPNNYFRYDVTSINYSICHKYKLIFFLIFIPFCKLNNLPACSFDLLCQFKCNFLWSQSIIICSKLEGFSLWVIPL